MSVATPGDGARYRRLKSIYLAVRERAADERAAAIEELCAGDSSLEAEVKELLAVETQIEGAATLTADSALALPDRLGEYTIEGVLGAGGMGIVLEGVDPTLGRRVAIKLLAPHLVASDAARERLIAEARALAALNHPHIATVYGLETQGDRVFLVMEKLSGVSLEEREKVAPLSLDETLRVAIQVCDALEVAHRRGIVHRDLKPANVQVAEDADGRLHAKVLDFGIATKVPPVGVGASGAATLTIDQQPVAFAGTAAYMSPEQVRSGEVDARADVWALGCVLFELLTKRRAFSGETLSDTIAAVLREHPDWSLLDGTPDVLARRVVRGCLKRDLRERRQSIADVRIDLEEVAGGSLLAVPSSTTPSKPRFAVWAAATLALGTLGFLLGWMLRSDVDSMDASQLIESFRPITDLTGTVEMPALSPDGRQLLFTRRDGGDLDVFVQRVDGRNPTNLTADFDGDDLGAAFSPDGQRIVFSSERNGGGLFVMGATGESPVQITSEGFDPSWSPDGAWIAYTTERVRPPTGRSTRAAIRTVSATGSEPVTLVEADGVAPVWSPNAKLIAYWGLQVGGTRDLFVVPRAGGSPINVTNDTEPDWNPVFGPDGDRLYFASERGGGQDVFSIAIDETTGAPRGPVQRVTVGAGELGGLSISSDGLRLAISVLRTGTDFVEYRFDSRLLTLQQPRTLHSSRERSRVLRLDPTGRFIASTSESRSLFVIDRDTLRTTVLAGAAGVSVREPFFSADGEWILYRSDASGSYNLWAMRRQGGQAKQVTDFGESGILVAVPNYGSGRIWLTLVEGSSWVTAALDGGLSDLSELAEPYALDALEVFEGVGLGLDEVSPDGSLLGGGLVEAPFRFHIHRRSDGLTEPLRREDGTELFQFDQWPHYLDEDRLLVWDERDEKARLWNLRSGETRTFDGFPGPANYVVTPGGDSLIVNLRRSDSEVWLLSLEDPTGPNP